ncbi:MAG: phage holin family protein [Pseudoclavibacter sp.]|nr:phage holin family protein [Pseudoclavibacter sp.]
MSDTGQKEPLRDAFPYGGRPGRDRAGRTGSTIGELLARIPKLATELIRNEIEHLKREMAGKGRRYGVAAGLFAAAAFFLLTMYVLLVTALVAGISEALPLWASALIVAGGMLLLAALLGLFGYLRLKRAGGVKPEQSLESIQQDIRAVKGLGRYE